MGLQRASTQPRIRPPAVAGAFYPDDPSALRSLVKKFIAGAAQRREQGGGAAVGTPRALIAPHAGYPYSGPVAGTAYHALGDVRDRYDRVLLLGPSHRLNFSGSATSEADQFDTPLGRVPVDREAVAELETLPFVQPIEQAHAHEHGLEVHLPFLTEVLGSFSIVPVVVSDAAADDVARIIERLWRDEADAERTLVVISSDLSHYHDYETATRLDGATSRAIENLSPQSIGADQACGAVAIRAMLLTAQARHLSAHTLDLRNSGDTAGPRDHVVGYGAYVFD